MMTGDVSSTVPRRNSSPWLVSLVVVTGVGPLATDTYLAAMPAMAGSLRTSNAAIQLSITVFIVGVAVGQLTAGPVSDARGRRGLLLVGTTLFTVATVLTAVAWNAPVLLAARTVQGLAAGVGVAIGRAVVTDVWSGAKAAQRFGTLTAITLLGPVLAPGVGGLILGVGTWRTIFVALAVFGAVMVAAVAVGIPETMSADRRGSTARGATVARMGALLHDRVFLGHVVVQCLATAGFFVYIGGSSFVLQHVYELSEQRYTLLFTTNALAMVATTVIFRVTVARVGAARLRTVGITTAAACGIGLLAVALFVPAGRLLALTWLLLAGVVAAMGLAIPATTTIAQNAGARTAGTASALQGGLTFLAGAAATPLTGVLGNATLLPMAALMAVLLVASRGVLAITSRRRTGASS